MTSDADKFWSEMAPRLRRARQFRAPTIEEAQAELDAAEPVPMSDEQIDAIVEAANAYVADDCQSESQLGTRAWSGADLSDQVPVLNRNPGKSDEESDRTIDQVRRDAFAPPPPRKSSLDWKIEQQREEQAASAAEELLASLNVHEAPVDPIAIAEAEKPLLHLRGADFKERFDGQLEYYRDQQQFLLLFNTKYDAGCREGHHPRTRFSIAHELGHYFLEAHRNFLIKGGKSHPSHSEFYTETMREREADAFAAALLMPSSLMAPLVNEVELSVERIKGLSAHFQTSILSTAVRSIQLSDFPCALAAIRNGSVAWKFQSKCFVEAGCYPRSRSSVAVRSVRERWAEFASGGIDFPPSISSVRDWFETYDRVELGEVDLAEQFFAVPIMGLLLVLLTAREADLFPDVDD